MTQHKWRDMTDVELEPHLGYWGSGGRVQFFAVCEICGCVRRTAGSIKKERFYTFDMWAITYYKAPACKTE